MKKYIVFVALFWFSACDKPLVIEYNDPAVDSLRMELNVLNAQLEMLGAGNRIWDSTAAVDIFYLKNNIQKLFRVDSSIVRILYRVDSALKEQHAIDSIHAGVLNNVINQMWDFDTALQSHLHDVYIIQTDTAIIPTMTFYNNMVIHGQNYDTLYFETDSAFRELLLRLLNQ